ncbi:hypothetical protein ABK040_010605 [Willaertia magna]
MSFYLILFLLPLFFLFLHFLYQFLLIIKNIYFKDLKIPFVGFQFLFSPFKLPFIAQHIYYGNFKHLLNLSNKFGKIFKISFPFCNVICISDKYILKELFKNNNFYCKPLHYYYPYTLFAENILSAPNMEIWKRHHKVCVPAFSSKNLEFTCKQTVLSMDLLFSQWDSCQVDDNTKNGNVLNLNDFALVTLDVLGKVGFGIDFNIFVDNITKNGNTTTIGKQFRQELELLLSKGLFLYKFLKSFPYLRTIIFNYLKITKAKEFVEFHLNEMIKNRKIELLNNTNMERDDLLSLLIEANEMENNLLTEKEVISNAFIFCLAGHETTATLMEWVCYRLAKHLDLQELLFNEIKNINLPKYEDFDKLIYLQAFIMETLRIHPSIAMVIKEVIKDHSIKGNNNELYDFKKGNNVMILIYATHYNEEIWNNPLEFNPMRFIENEKILIPNDCSWIPFSMGNRKCIGYKMALLEAAMITCRLLQKYKLEMITNENIETIGVKAGISLRPTDNLKIKLIKRNN